MIEQKNDKELLEKYPLTEKSLIDFKLEFNRIHNPNSSKEVLKKIAKNYPADIDLDSENIENTVDIATHLHKIILNLKKHIKFLEDEIIKSDKTLDEIIALYNLADRDRKLAVNQLYSSLPHELQKAGEKKSKRSHLKIVK